MFSLRRNATMISIGQKFFWRIFAAIGLATVLVSCVTTKRDRDEAEYHLRIGTTDLMRANYPGALTELLLAEKLDPNNVLVQNNLGLVYFFDEHFNESIKHLELALKIKPDFSEARNNYGRVLIEMGRADQAISQLKRVLADLTYSDPAKAWINLGLAYFKKNDFSTAQEKFFQAMKIDRNNCLAQTYYGRSLLEMGRLTDAAQALDNAVVICRPVKFDEPHYFSGLTYYKLGRTSSAIARMEEVIQMYPMGRYAKRAESMLKLMK